MRAPAKSPPAAPVPGKPARSIARTLVLLIALAAIAFASAALAQDAPDDASGTPEGAAAADSGRVEEAASGAAEGFWQGILTLPNGSDFRIIFRVWREDDGTLSSLMDSPDQGAADLPVDRIVVRGDTVRFEMSFAGAYFEGVMADDATAMDGTWRQAAIEMPLTLTRLEEFPEVRRAQEPREPYPYASEEVTYANEKDGVTLTGSITIPHSEERVPAAILISGSGAQDRDEAVFGHRPFLVMADYLTRRGIAVLRVDDRGIGGSTGSVAQSTSEDLAGDVEAGFRYLMARDEIDPAKVGLIGHSEGGIIGPMVAAGNDDVAFLVLLAAPGLPGEEVLYSQAELISRAAGATEADVAGSRAIQERVFEVLKEEGDEDARRERLRSVLRELPEEATEAQQIAIATATDEQIEEQIDRVLAPWFMFFLTYDPEPTLREVCCPVLALIGEKDLQVPAEENLDAIEDALDDGCAEDYTVRKLEGLNHLFQTAITGLPTEYASIDETMSPLVLGMVVDWIKETTE